VAASGGSADLLDPTNDNIWPINHDSVSSGKTERKFEHCPAQ
jgi:hypothetical protein